jgi:putative salt-induced outer membrane protein YdiY
MVQLQRSALLALLFIALLGTVGLPRSSQAGLDDSDLALVGPLAEQFEVPADAVTELLESGISLDSVIQLLLISRNSESGLDAVGELYRASGNDIDDTAEQLDVDPADYSQERVAAAIDEAQRQAQTETVELSNGDKVTGTVVERTDEKIVLDHEIFGRIEIPVAQLMQPEPPNPGLFGTGFLEGWTRTFSLGLSGQEGNSKTLDIIAALDFDSENEKRRWTFDARYNYSTADGDKTNNNAMVALGRDWLFGESRWFTFARGRFDYDDFRTWTYRIQGDAGVGYEIIQWETFELRGRTGPSVVQEWKEDQFRAEWLAGPEIVWSLTPSQKLEASNIFYYSFTPWAEFRNVSNVNWKWDLAQNPALSLNAGLENEYQSDVASGVKKNDLKYYTSIGIDF